MKIRLYELAQQYGVDSKAVMALLQELGEFVRSASSTIEPPIEAKLRARLAGDVRDDVRPVLQPKPDRQAPPFVPPPTKSRFSSPRPRRRTISLAQLAPLERLMARRAGMGPRLTDDRVYIVRSAARRWAENWFDERTAAPWVMLDMSPKEARQCENLGITPSMMRLPFRMRGKPLCGGSLTYKGALDRGVCTIPEIHTELTRQGHGRSTGNLAGRLAAALVLGLVGFTRFEDAPLGHLSKWAERYGGNWPIHTAALMMRTNSLRALGGWAEFHSTTTYPCSRHSR